MENNGKKKILIADDEKDWVRPLADRLEFEGYEVIVAYEGVRAIEMAHKGRPDLILLDLQMPGGTGQSVLHALRANSETERIPMIIITGLPGKDLERELLAAGAQGFIRKPCDSNKLLSRIETALSSAAK